MSRHHSLLYALSAARWLARTGTAAGFAVLWVAALGGAPAAASAATANADRYFTVNLRHGTSAYDTQAVARYFSSFGLTARVRHGILFVHGPEAQVAAAGHTTLAGGAFDQAAHPPTFPREIGAHVLATTLGGGPGGARAGGAPHSDLYLLPKYGFTPAGLAQFYHAQPLYTAGTNGTGENVALLGCSSFSQSDLSAFESLMGLPNNVPTIVAVDGGSTFAAAPTTIDVENVVAAAPGAGVVVYVAPYCTSPSCPALTCSLAEEADQFAAVAADMPTHHFAAVSVAYGASEDFYAAKGDSGDMTATDADIQSIVADGGTVFAASGVWGAGPPSAEVLSAGEFTAFYPASDPHAIGVGGTAAIPQPSSFNRQAELGWGGSGGAVSSVYAITSFQKAAKGVASKTMRNVPDVAYVGSANMPVAGYYSGKELSASGTNAGADYWAGFIALADQARVAAGKSPLTNVAKHLYAARKVAGTFVAVTQGCNGYYCAGEPEYNNVTGLGVPDVAHLVNYLKGLP
jgi:subtilase family serine protease